MEWTPVTEQLPDTEYDMPLLLTYLDDGVAVVTAGRYDKIKNEFYDYEERFTEEDGWTRYPELKKVIAWMKTPEPYQP